MSDIILYGSKYGSTRRYAIALSEQTGIPAIEYSHAPALSDKRVIVYLGGLYAGGVLGLAKTLRGLALREEQKLILVTVGLADPTRWKTKTTSGLPCNGNCQQRCLIGQKSIICGAVSIIKSSRTATGSSWLCYTNPCAKHPLKGKQQRTAR